MAAYEECAQNQPLTKKALFLTVIQARLTNLQFRGEEAVSTELDPYVKLLTSCGASYQTKVVYEAGIAPVWNESLSLDFLNSSE